MSITVVDRPDVERQVKYSARTFGNEGFARLRVWTARRVAVLSEPENNTGASITNAAEDAWGVVGRVLGFDPVASGWTLVEHYPANGSRGDIFDVVSFAGRDGSGRLAGVKWAPAILEPRLAWLRAAQSWTA